MKKEKKQVANDGTKKNFFKKHKKGLIILGVLLIVGGGIGACVASTVNSVQDLMTSQYATTTLEKRNIINSVSVNGSVASEQKKDVSVAVTNTDIVELKVEVGDIVKEGDIIAVLDSTDIEESLTEAKQALKVASSSSNSSISSATDSLANTQESAQINEARAAESETAAYNSYASAGATEAAAKKEYDAAVADKNAAKTAYDTAVANTAAAQTAYDAAMVANGVNEANFNTALSAVKAADAKTPLVYAWDTVTISSTLPAFTAPDITVDADLTDTSKTAWTEGATTVADGAAKKDAINAAITTLSGTLVDHGTTYTDAVNATVTEKATLDAAKATEATALADYNAKLAVVDQKKATYDAAKATREAQGKAYQSAAEAYDDLERTNDNTIETQQDNLNSTKLNATTATTAQENQVEMYEEQLEDCIIRAPFDGTITAVNFEEGDKYTGTPLFTIQDVEGLTITANIPEYDIADIEKGMRVVFKADTTGDEEMYGEVTFVSPVPNAGGTSITYPIEITIQNPNERLRLGMTAKANIIMDEVTDVFAVPYECIKTDEDGNNYVDVVVENAEGTDVEVTDETVAQAADAVAALTQQTEKVYVEIGLVTDYYTEITGKNLVEGMKIQLTYMDTTLTDALTPGVTVETNRNQ
jgi:RND family efflux transporter MFP subunit